MAFLTGGGAPDVRAPLPSWCFLFGSEGCTYNRMGIGEESLNYGVDIGDISK